MELMQLIVGVGNTSVIFRLDLDLTARDYKVVIKDEAVQDARALDNLVRRKTSILTKHYPNN